MHPEDLAQPGVFTDGGDLGKGHVGRVAPGALPQEHDEVQGDVVEHQGQQGLVGAEPGLEEGGNRPP